MDFHVRVKRWDNDFLKRLTFYNDPLSGMEGIYQTYFLDVNGETVSRLCSWWRLFLGTMFPGFFVPETIGQALETMPSKKLRCIWYVVIVDVGLREIILWKAPKGFDSIAYWLYAKAR
jgi:hypothetical protein